MDQEPPLPGLARRLEHPTTRLWSSFDPDVSHKARLPILCGVPPQMVDDVMLISTARSRPAVRLMARAPGILRSLAHQTTAYNERCVGHVRGPIVWSETITAWASGVGVDDVFICSSPQRDFDVPENRLLVWLLKRLVLAGRRATGDAAGWFPAESIELVRGQSRAAQKLLEHRALRSVLVRKPTGRELRSIRQSRHAATYAPVVKLANRVARPFEREEVRSLVSQPTVEQHRVMLMVMDRLRERGQAVPLLTVRGDFISSGQLRYRNPAIFVDRRITGLSGLFYGDTRLLSVADEFHDDDVLHDGTPRRQARIETADDADDVIVQVMEAALERNDAEAHSTSGFTQLPGS